jgi:hypothetical protein
VFLAFAIRPRPIAVRHVVLFAAPPLLWWLGLAALTRDPAMPLRTARLVAGAMASRYVVQYQSGPPQRLLVDFLFLSPLAVLLACAAVVLLLRDVHASAHMRGLAAFVLIALAAFSLMASKNLRCVVMLDPFLRIAAAWLIVHPIEGRTARPASIVALVAANTAIDIELFHAVFIRGAVYDPVTRTLFAALGAVPRDGIAPPEPMLWPWICVVIAAVWWMIPQARGAVTNKLAVS